MGYARKASPPPLNLTARNHPHGTVLPSFLPSWAWPAALILAVAACAESPALPEPPTLAASVADEQKEPIGTRCHEGFCTGDEDPFPDSAGVWISNTVTDDLCFGGGTNDIDQDGLSDFCENNLAEAFAPQLVLAPALNDPATREPRWAARPLGNNQVMIAYLLSYHNDGGSASYLCDLVPGPIPYFLPPQVYYPCAAHPGDSEHINLIVEYRPATQHWLLVEAAYSAHTGYNTYKTPGTYPKKLQYPDRVGGRPRAYVATSKHANYASSLECNNGGTLGVDSCDPSRYEIVTTGANNNIGSDAVKFVDCIGSGHPVYGPLGHQECYWTGTTFHGWTGAIGFPAPTMGYRPRLIFAGFI